MSKNSKITFFKHRWIAHFVCFQFLPTCFCFRLFLMDFHASSITHTRSSPHIYTSKSVGPRLLFGKTNTKCQTVVSFMPNLLLCMEHFLYIPSKFSLCVRWQDDLIWIIYKIIYVYGKNWVKIWILFALFNVLNLVFFFAGVIDVSLNWACYWLFFFLVFSQSVILSFWSFCIRLEIGKMPVLTAIPIRLAIWIRVAVARAALDLRHLLATEVAIQNQRIKQKIEWLLWQNGAGYLDLDVF